MTRNESTRLEWNELWRPGCVLALVMLAGVVGCGGASEPNPTAGGEAAVEDEALPEEMSLPPELETDEPAVEAPEADEPAVAEPAEPELAGRVFAGPVGPIAEPAEDLTSQAFVREWYVSTTGSDSASGTATAPFRTIRRAISAAGPGERITVRAGTYAERVDIGPSARDGRPDARIVLRGEGKPRIVPADSYWIMVTIRRPYWTMTGFDIDARSRASVAVAFTGDTRGSVLSGSEVHHGSHIAGVTTFGNARDVTITGNVIHDFYKSFTEDSHGVLVQPSSVNITIRNNQIYGNSGDSIQCINNEGTGKPAADGVLIENNDLHSSVEQAIDIKTCYNVVVRRNKMHHFRPHGNGTMVVHLSARNILVEENDMYDAGLGIGVGGVRLGPVPYNVVIRRNLIHDMITTGGMTGGGIKMENCDSAKIYNNTMTRLATAGLILGGGEGGATSNLTVKNNLVDAAVAVKLGRYAPGLSMDNNLYRPGSAFRGPDGTMSFDQWRARGLDVTSWQAALGLDPTTLVPGPNAIDRGARVEGVQYCGGAPDIGAVETGCR